MKRLFLLVLAALCAATAAFASVRISELHETELNVKRIVRKVKPALPANLAPGVADSLDKATLKDRSDTEIWLQTAPTSYLAAIARRDFGQKRVMTVGSDAANDVRLDDPNIRPRDLRVTVVGDSFRVDPLDPSAYFWLRGDSLRNATLGPGSIKVGRFTLRLSHQNYPAVIVFDPQSPRLGDYKGLKWYPVDPHYRFVAPLTPNPDPDTVQISSTHSQPRDAVRAGWFVLNIGGKKVILEVNRLVEPGIGENAYSVFFRDKTTGKETYPVGRYLDVTPYGDGTYLLDFNNAYNPACAVSPYYNCPIPPKFNKLSVAIPAGEMDDHYQH